MFSNYPTTEDQKRHILTEILRGEREDVAKKNHRNPLNGKMVGMKLVKLKDPVSKERPLS